MPEPPPNRTVMIVLAYLWPLAIVPLLVDKEDADVQWHAKHGLVLMGAELLLFLLFTILTTVVSLILTTVVSLATFGLGCVFALLGVFIWVGIAALHVTAIIKGINGTRLIVPKVSEYADRF